MSNWIHSTLEKICLPDKGAIISGPFGSNISRKFFVSQGVPVIRGNNLTLGKEKFIDNDFAYITPEKAEELNCYALRNDLVFTAAGTLGQVGVLTGNLRFEKYVISNKQLRARIDSSKVDLLYAYYWYSSPWMQQYFITNNKGSTVPLVTLSELKSAPITYPESIDEQRKIASIFENITSKIDLNTRLCTELEAMAKTLYDYWFMQFDFPDENGKPYRTSGGAMEWCQELGREVLKGWRPYKIGEMLGPIPNTTRVQTGEYNKEGAIPIIDQSVSFIAGYTNDESALLFSDSGYIVFGDHTRIVKYIRFPFARGADGTQVIDSNSPCMPNELFYQTIRSIDLSNQGYARHYKFLKETMILVPDETIAKLYQKTVSPLYGKITKIVFENVELEKLRDWLLPMLMNGQAYIREIR